MRRVTYLLASTTAIAAIAAASPALAQSGAQPVPQPSQTSTGTEPTASTETNAATNQAAAEQAIVVTGVRRALQSARNIRKNSQQIIDSVVAEDIGKLPDLNTAETAARIPGVQVYRQGGEAQNVLVRGLPFFTTTYNGREIFTAETRVVALQDFPSSNIAALEVYKTSSADLVEPGLAGLVNVRSRQPFDFSGAQFAGSVWGLYTRQGREVTPNFNLLATKRWTTPVGEIGLLLNGSVEQMRYLDAEISNTDFIADPTINGQRVRLPDIQRLFYRSGKRIRPSVNGALQWRPNPGLEFYLEGLWQGFRNEIDDRLLEQPLYAGLSYSNINLRSGTNLVSSGTVVEPPQRLFSFQGGTHNQTNTYQFAGGTKWTSGPVKLHLDIARSQSEFKGSTESVDRVWNQNETVNFNLERPSFDITGIDLRDPSTQIFSGLFEQNQRSIGHDWQGRADAEYDFNSPWLKNIQVGARWTSHKANRNFGDRFAFLRPLNLPPASLPLDFAVFHGVGRANPTFNWSAPTYASIRDNVEALRQFVINHCAQILITDPNNGCRAYVDTTPVHAGLLFRAKEHTLAGYGQVNFGNDVIDGQVGVRWLRVRTRVAGPVPTGIPAIDEGSKHSIWLPNASIRWRATPELQLRAAMSKTETRPNFGDLVPSITLGAPPSNPGGVGTQDNPRLAFGGNPFLQPFTSWNYDAAVEYYFAPAAFVSLTGFHHNVDGFIQQSTFRFTDPTLGVVQVTGPVNAGKGRISGLELQGQTFFDYGFLPDWARGFGVQANVTYIKAKTEQFNGTSTNGIPNLSFFPITDQLNGVSKWNYNLVGIYERYGFSARLSYSGRSKFAATRQYRGDDLYLETAHPAGRLDLSLNYNLNDSWTLFGDWTNITRRPFHQDFSSARAGAPRAEYVRYLRYDESTLSAGVRFKFGEAPKVAAAPLAPPPPRPVVQQPAPVEPPAPPPPPAPAPERG